MVAKGSTRKLPSRRGAPACFIFVCVEDSVRPAWRPMVAGSLGSVALARAGCLLVIVLSVAETAPCTGEGKVIGRSVVLSA